MNAEIEMDFSLFCEGLFAWLYCQGPGALYKGIGANVLGNAVAWGSFFFWWGYALFTLASAYNCHIYLCIHTYTYVNLEMKQKKGI